VWTASGRNSQAPKWLEGLQRLKRQSFNSFLGCTSYQYQRPTNSQTLVAKDLLGVAPDHGQFYRAGMLYPIGDHWILTVTGCGSRLLMKHSFLEFTRSLRSPIYYAEMH